jgi:hypothetical protein
MEPLQNRELTEPLRAITRHAALTYFHKHLSHWQFQGLAAIVKTEAKLRQWLHSRRGNHREAKIMHHLQQMARDMAQCQPDHARQQLDAVLQLADMASPLKQ